MKMRFLFNLSNYNFFFLNSIFLYKQPNSLLKNFFIKSYRFFKKKRKNRKKKPKIRIRRYLLLRFFRWRRFRFKKKKFKKIRKHIKIFRIKKKYIRRDIIDITPFTPSVTDSRFLFFYNFYNKIINFRKIKLKKQIKTYSNAIDLNKVFYNFFHIKKKNYKKSLFKLSQINDKMNTCFKPFLYIFPLLFYSPKLLKSKLVEFNFNFFKKISLPKSLYRFFFKYRFKIIKNKKLKNWFKKNHRKRRKQFKLFFLKKLKKFFIKNFKYNYIFNISINNRLFENSIKSVVYDIFNLHVFYITYFFFKKSFKVKFYKTRFNKFKHRRRLFKYKRWKKKTFFWTKRFKIRFYNFRRKKQFKSKFKRRAYKSLITHLLTNYKYTHNLNSNSICSFFNYKIHKKYYYFYKRVKKNLIFFNFLKINSSFSNSLIKYSYNNYSPVYNLPRIFIKKFKKFFKSIMFKKYFKHLQYYAITSIEHILQKKFFLKSLNNNFMKRKKFFRKNKFKRLKKIYFKIKKNSISRKNRFNLKEILEIIFYSFYFKDLYLLKNWFSRNYYKLHHKNQRRFLALFKSLIESVFATYKNMFLLKGFYFIIKGKVGVTSNAKKKRVFFRVGPLSKSVKKQKIDFQQGVINSMSGSCGFLMILTYF